MKEGIECERQKTGQKADVRDSETEQEVAVRKLCKYEKMESGGWTGGGHESLIRREAISVM